IGDLAFSKCVHLCVEVIGVEIDLHVWNAFQDMSAKCGQLQIAKTIYHMMPRENVVSWTSMVYAYAREGFLDFSKKVFDQMPIKNVVSWNSMITCIQNGQSMGALDLFCKICASQVVLDEATLVAITLACGHLGLEAIELFENMPIATFGLIKLPLLHCFLLVVITVL
ncbi:hypothetical protein Ancab_028938, partial [Ancistrocladus abbreviatus]